jgi:hypothetical protein
MSSRPNPSSSFEAQLPPPERNPLAFTVSAFFHTILILAILLASKKLQEQSAKTHTERPLAPDRSVQMVYLPPPPAPRPVPVSPPSTPVPPVPVPTPPRVVRPPEPDPNAPTDATRHDGPGEREGPRAPASAGEPEATADEYTNAPPMVDPAQALNASMEAEAQRIFGRKRGGPAPDAGPTATRPFANAKIPDSKCPDIPRDSLGKPVGGQVRGRVVDLDTGRPLSNAHLQMLNHPYNTFADANGSFLLKFDLMLMADCRTQFVRIDAPGHRAQTLPIVMGGGISTVPLKRR